MSCEIFLIFFFAVFFVMQIELQPQRGANGLVQVLPIRTRPRPAATRDCERSSTSKSRSKRNETKRNETKRSFNMHKYPKFNNAN